MLIYIVKRLAQLVPGLFGITLACFLLLRALPGDPATLLLGARGGPEEIALMKRIQARLRELAQDAPSGSKALGGLSLAAICRSPR